MTTWSDICALDEILPYTGVAALIGRKQVAVVRVGADRVHAIANFDPFSKAFVLARGIVGDAKGVPKIASPVYKQSFDLRSGQCLEDPTVRIPIYDVRIRAGRIEVMA
jgi:nitrite reductase (NADH) small subunit